MNRFFCMALAFALTACVAGYAKPRSITLKASPPTDQMAKYDHGRQFFISTSSYTRVVLTLSTSPIKPESLVNFHVSVENGSGNLHFHFSTNSVSASCDLNPVLVYSPEMLLREAGNKMRIDPVTAGLRQYEDIMKDVNESRRLTDLKAQNLLSINQTLLREENVAPRSIHQGTVFMAFPSCVGKLNLMINAGNDVHSFVFDIIEKK